jgi:hypothetical protein
MKSIGEHPWRGIVLAPLAIPLLFSAAFEISAPGQRPLLGFLVMFVLGSVVSYGATLFLLVPSLLLLSRLVALSAVRTGLVGTALGGVTYLPIGWILYRASGTSSGSPKGTFAQYLLAHGLGWEMWAFPLAGLTTALLFWFLANPRRKTRGSCRSSGASL